jgi:GDPmannose 4,6-dehydratase
VYRESFNLYAVQGICFNHESERRQRHFVTRKITCAVANITRKLQKGEHFYPIKLGNLNALRDWSHAEDIVDAVWRMLNQEEYNPTIRERCQQ